HPLRYADHRGDLRLALLPMATGGAGGGADLAVVAAHPGRPCLPFTYALGQAQRGVAALAAAADRPVLVHGAMVAMTEIYRQAGVQMLPRATCIRWARAADLACLALSEGSFRVPDTLQSGRLRPCPRACRNS